MSPGKVPVVPEYVIVRPLSVIVSAVIVNVAPDSVSVVHGMRIVVVSADVQNSVVVSKNE